MTLSTVGTSTLPAMTTVPSPFLLFLFPLPSFLSRFMTTFPSTLLPLLFSLLFLLLFLGRWIFLAGSWVGFLGWWIFRRGLAMRLFLLDRSFQGCTARRVKLRRCAARSVPCAYGWNVILAGQIVNFWNGRWHGGS